MYLNPNKSLDNIWLNATYLDAKANYKIEDGKIIFKPEYVGTFVSAEQIKPGALNSKTKLPERENNNPSINPSLN